MDKSKFLYSSKAPAFRQDKNAKALLADKSFTESLEKDGHLCWEDGIAYFDTDAVKKIMEECDKIQREKRAD